jgi:hypothetical protein
MSTNIMKRLKDFDEGSGNGKQESLKQQEQSASGRYTVKNTLLKRKAETHYLHWS